jgi:hypothetical protein
MQRNFTPVIIFGSAENTTEGVTLPIGQFSGTRPSEHAPR